ncbi:hypothetical protein [Pseudomonas synxantha]|uniref:hypothetical protein n=1 Tax=Pseudomonas synxantha TaxID=47883 RepID=UPI000F564F3D|nr:hypothetical protein [Pseudomonas synxantha]
MRSQAEKSADYTYCLIEIKFKRENYWSQKNNQAINTKDQQNRAYSNHAKESKIARREQHIKLVFKPEPEIQTTKNIAENNQYAGVDDYTQGAFYEKDRKLTRERMNSTPEDENENNPEISPLLTFFSNPPPTPRAPSTSTPAALKPTTHWD